MSNVLSYMKKGAIYVLAGKEKNMTKNISKRRMKERIKEKLYEGIVQPVTTFQKRPNTCVVFDVQYEGKTYNMIGFSKVNWPDDWDEDYGVSMAIEKAVSDLAKQIIASMPISEFYKIDYQGER